MEIQFTKNEVTPIFQASTTSFSGCFSQALKEKSVFLSDYLLFGKVLAG
jgi:hypothetical protein